jgi:hypothetical protein
MIHGLSRVLQGKMEQPTLDVSCLRTIKPVYEAMNCLLKFGLRHKTACMTKMKKNV